MQEKVIKKRLVYLDILNIFAMFAVVALHVNGIVHNNPNIRAWNTSLIIKCLFYWGVPVYLMISGATLMNYRSKYDTKTFFKKRFVKVLIPFIFWAGFMFAYRLRENLFSHYDSFADFLNAFFANHEESTYYFLFDILGLYLTMPILSLLTEVKHRKTLWFTVLLYFIFNGTLPYILLLFGVNYNYAFSVKLGRYVIYIILGYLLSTQDLHKSKKYIYMSAILGILWRYVLTFYLSKKTGEVYKDVWGYTSWFTIILSMAVFTFIKNLTIIKKIETKPKIQDFLAKVASCSFGIYLIQMVIIELFIKFFNINEYSWQYRTFGIFAIYLICLIIVMIMKNIPLVRKLVP